jgi:transposase-like protein
MLAVAEMYIKGVSTRDVEAVMAEFGVVCLSSSQVSRATRLLDEELAARAATAHSARSSISSSGDRFPDERPVGHRHRPG